MIDRHSHSFCNLLTTSLESYGASGHASNAKTPSAPALGMSHGGKIAILSGQAAAQEFSLPRRVGAIESPSSSGTLNGIPIRSPAFLHLRIGSEVVFLLSTTMVFGSALKVTPPELAIECFSPVDASTRKVLGSRT